MPDTPTIEIVEPDTVHQSVARERMVEMALLAELTQESWFGRGQVFDVMHSTVDAYGHDLVLECGDVLLHVQLKARTLNGATRETNINVALADRLSGCVIWTSYGRRPGVSAVLGTAYLLAPLFGPIS